MTAKAMLLGSRLVVYKVEERGNLFCPGLARFYRYEQEVWQEAERCNSMRGWLFMYSRRVPKSTSTSHVSGEEVDGVPKCRVVTKQVRNRPA